MHILWYETLDHKRGDILLPGAHREKAGRPPITKADRCPKCGLESAAHSEVVCLRRQLAALKAENEQLVANCDKLKATLARITYLRDNPLEGHDGIEQSIYFIHKLDEILSNIPAPLAVVEGHIMFDGEHGKVRPSLRANLPAGKWDKPSCTVIVMPKEDSHAQP